MIKVSDYIVRRLEDYGVEHVFMVAGGGAMHLNDSLGKSKQIEYICCHHEQACAMAAEGYARATGKLGVVMVTSGPGGTNALTGVLGQWTDSVPVLYISGQVKQTTMGAGVDGLRQLGDQEINIIDIVRPVTKYAEVVADAKDIEWHLGNALRLATTGRPGPVWLDIPLDVQSAMVDERFLTWFVPEEEEVEDSLPVQAAQVVALLQTAERPLLLAGHGIRIAKAQKLFLEFAEKTGIPVVTSFNGMDLMPSDHPLFAGRIGTIGQRSGNYALQNCDLLISIGSRNNIRQISYDWGNFAPQAKKVIVDIDAAELNKPTIKPDIVIHADAKDFLRAILPPLQGEGQCGDGLNGEDELRAWRTWLQINDRPFFNKPHKRDDGLVEPYHFIEVLTDLLPEDAIIVSGNGTASVCLFQAGKIKSNTRVIMNSGCAAMGYDLPAAIGACIGSRVKGQGSRVKGQGSREIVCITGDGSIQMNIQELQTIAHHKLPIKIFVLNNGGYHSIKQTQDNYFEGRHVGAGPDSGVSCPDIRKISDAYEIPSFGIYFNNRLPEEISALLGMEGPVICEVRLTRAYKFDKLNLSDFRR